MTYSEMKRNRKALEREQTVDKYEKPMTYSEMKPISNIRNGKDTLFDDIAAFRKNAVGENAFNKYYSHGFKTADDYTAASDYLNSSVASLKDYRERLEKNRAAYERVYGADAVKQMEDYISKASAVYSDQGLWDELSRRRDSFAEYDSAESYDAATDMTNGEGQKLDSLIAAAQEKYDNYNRNNKLRYGFRGKSSSTAKNISKENKEKINSAKSELERLKQLKLDWENNRADYDDDGNPFSLKYDGADYKTLSLAEHKLAVREYELSDSEKRELAWLKNNKKHYATTEELENELALKEGQAKNARDESNRIRKFAQENQEMGSPEDSGDLYNHDPYSDEEKAAANDKAVRYEAAASTLRNYYNERKADEQLEKLQQEIYDKYMPLLDDPEFLKHSEVEKDKESDVYFGADNTADVYNNPANMYNVKMTDKERSVFYGLYNTDKNRAAEFLDELTPVLNERITDTVTQVVQEDTQDNPYMHSALAVLSNLASGISSVEDTWNGMTGKGIDTNSPSHLLSRYTSTVRGTTSQMLEDYLKKNPDSVWNTKFALAGRDENGNYRALGLFAKETAESIMDNLARMAVTKGIGAAAGGGEGISKAALETIDFTLMGSQVASQTIIDAKEKGLSDGKALAMGFTSGAIEAITEIWSVEKVLKDPKGFIGALGKSLVAESSEEISSNILNRAVDILVNADQSDVMQEYYGYINEGLSPSEASAKTITGILGDDLSAGLGGALSGLVMTGGNYNMAKAVEINESAKRGIKQIQVGNRLKTSDSVITALDEIIKANPENTQAIEAKAAIEKGEKVSARKLGKLLSDEVSSQFEKAYTVDRNEIKTKLEAKGVENANSLSETIAKAFNEGIDSVKGKERTALTHNADAMAVYNEYRTAQTTAAESADRLTLAYSTAGREQLLNYAKEQGRNSGFLQEAADLAEGKTDLDSAIDLQTAVETEIADRFLSANTVEEAQEVFKELSNGAGKDITAILKDSLDTRTDDILAESKYDKVTNVSFKNTRDGVAAYVTTKNGENLSPFVANIGSESAAVINRATAKPAEARTLYATEYLNGNNYLAASSYDRAFTKYYEAGKKGTSFADIKRSTRDIKGDSARRIYEAGRKAAKAETKRQIQYRQTDEYKNRSEARTEANTKAEKTGGVVRDYSADRKVNKNQRGQLRLLDEWAKQKGVVIRVVGSLAEKLKLEGQIINGQYAGGNVIVIALDGKNMLTSTAGHELFHMIKNLAAEYAEDFTAFVIDHLKEAGKYESVFNDYARRYGRAYANDESFKAKIEEEIVAEHCFEALTNKEQWEKFAGEHKSIAEKIIDFIREFVAMINKAFDKYFVHDNAYIRDSVMSDVDYMNKIADMLWTGVDKAVENYRFGVGAENVETKYSVNPKFESEYDKWDKKSSRFSFLLGRTSSVLKSVGVRDANIRWDASKILKIKENHPAMTDEVIKQIPNILETPILIMNSKTVSGRLTLFGEVYDANGAPVLAVLELNPTSNNGKSLNLIKVASAYGKDVALQRFINTSDIIYQDKKRTDNWLKLNRLKLPLANRSSGSNTESNKPSADFTVPQKGDNVNTHSMQKSKNNSSFSVSDSNGNQLSENQQKYFANSKVRDKDGNLLVVKHGTNNEFNIFDFSKAGKNGAQEGYGFYFSDDPEITEKYGNIQKEVYLNITKPLYNNQITVNKNEIKKLANALIDFDIEKYADEGLTWQDSFLSNYVDTYSTSRANAVREFVDQLFSANDNDSDLVYEIAVADGRGYDPMLVKEFYNVLTNSTGYDGMIAEWEHKDGTSNVYVAFNSEQAKLIDNKNPTDNPDVRYSTSDSFEEQIDGVLNNTFDKNNHIYMGNTPNSLQSILHLQNRPMLITPTHVYTMTVSEAQAKADGRYVKGRNYHDLGKDILLGLPKALEKPLFLIKSSAKQNDLRIIAVTSLTDKNGVNILAAIKPDSRGFYSGVEIDSNFVLSGYGKSNVLNYVLNAKKEGRILYASEKNNRLGKSTPGVQFPDTTFTADYSNSLSQYRETVNKYYAQNDKEYLSNSNKYKSFELSDEVKDSISDAGMRLTDDAELSSLMRSNADYKAEIERLKSEFVKSKRMGGKGANRLVQTDINRIARNIIGEYSSGISFFDLKDELTGLYGFIANSEKNSWDYAYAVQAANNIAKSVIAQSFVDITPETFESYKKELRSHRLIPNLDDVAEMTAMFGTFGAAYRQYGKKLNMRAQGTENAVHIDEIWDDLCAAVPLLDKNAQNTQDMWRNLIEVRDSLDEKSGFNPYLGNDELSAEQSAAVLGADILERFYEISPDTTFADRAQQQVNIREQKISELKADKQEALKKLREQRDTKISELKESFRQQNQKRRERSSRTALRHKIKALTADMNRRLLYPKKNEYIPRELMSSVAGVLNAINLDSGKSAALSQKFSVLKSAYEAIQKSEKYQSAYDPVIADMIQNLVEKSSGKFTAVSKENLEYIYDTLKAVDKLCKDAIKVKIAGEEHNAKEFSKQLIKETRQAKDMGRLSQKYTFAQSRPEAVFERFGGFAKNSAWQKMYTLLNDGQLKKTSILIEGKRMFNELVEGKNKKNVDSLISINEKDLVDIGLVDSDGNSVKITRDMMNAVYMMLENEDNTRHLIYGGLTVPDLKGYYKGKNEAFGKGAVRAEIMQGKFVDEIHRIRERIETVKDSNAADKAEQLDELYEKRDLLVAQAYSKAAEIKNKIAEQMTDYDRAWIAKAKEFFDGFSRDQMNAVTLMVYGFEKARIENYFPIHTDSAFRNEDFGVIQKAASLENMGFTKERVFSGSPIMLEGLTDVINGHIDDIANYAGLMPSVREFQKVYGKNMTDENGLTSVQNALREKFGTQGRKYISDLLGDITGSRQRSGSAFFNRVRGNMAQATLSVNARVALSQAASYPTAAAEIGWKPLTKALGMGLKKADKALIAEYSPLLAYRMAGYSNPEIGNIKDLGKTQNKVLKNTAWLMNWITQIDGATVGRLWYASQFYVDDNNSQLKAAFDKATAEHKANSISDEQFQKAKDDYYNEVAKVFNRVVERTQPNYTTMQRPAVLRSDKDLIRSMTMFYTQRLQNVSILYDAFSRMRSYSESYKNNPSGDVTAEDVKTARNEFGRAVFSQIVATTTLTAMKTIVDILLQSLYAYRDPDDDITPESFWGNVGYNFLDSFVSNLLFGSEMLKIAKAAYQIYDGSFSSRNADDFITIGGVETINDFTVYLEKFGDSFSKYVNGEGDLEDLGKSGLNLAKITGTLTGVPVANIGKLVEGIVSLGDKIAEGKSLLSSGENKKTGTSSKKNMDKYNAAYAKADSSAAKEAVRTMIEEEKQKLLENGADQYAVNSKGQNKVTLEAKQNVRNKFSNEYRDKYKQAYRNKDTKTVAEIKTKLSLTGLYDNLDDTLEKWRDSADEDANQEKRAKEYAERQK